MELIVAVDKSWGMAKDGTIPWKFSNDMKYFMNVTKTVQDTNKQNIVIMGRKTWESLPEKHRPLTGRINIVISTTMNNNNANYYVVNSFENAVKMSLDHYFTNKVEKIFVIGGSNVYEEALQSILLQKVHVTYINQNYQCDLQFPKKLLFEKCWNDMSSQKDIIEKETELSFMIFESKKKFKGEDQYLDLLWKTYNEGHKRQTRNYICRSDFSGEMHFDLSEGFPLITTKKVFLRGVFEELKFFMMGDTNSNNLSAKGVNIWTFNTTREFLDSCNLKDYAVGTLGPIYGFNWRFFGAPYTGPNADYTGKGVDQLSYVINLLKKDKYSRRILMTTLNPSTVKDCVLWPCHGIVVQFHCGPGGKLNCNMYQRWNKI
ncbi:MAG: thymidylate synthase [Edafosvirus sp.]|uniref:thymidylate synthase n=1 Tax=Edafosvirus sp. TaxID=2487765 RepID=A0A3G4ZW42_9VIRU|nr:MAG: thymidylate synthase [Edafosvirus sp.]